MPARDHALKAAFNRNMLDRDEIASLAVLCRSRPRWKQWKNPPASLEVGKQGKKAKKMESKRMECESASKIRSLHTTNEKLQAAMVALKTERSVTLSTAAVAFGTG